MATGLSLSLDVHARHLIAQLLHGLQRAVSMGGVHWVQKLHSCKVGMHRVHGAGHAIGGWHCWCYQARGPKHRFLHGAAPSLPHRLMYRPALHPSQSFRDDHLANAMHLGHRSTHEGQALHQHKVTWAMLAMSLSAAWSIEGSASLSALCRRASTDPWCFAQSSEQRVSVASSLPLMELVCSSPELWAGGTCKTCQQCSPGRKVQLQE